MQLYLSCDGDLVILFVSKRALLFIKVIKGNADSSFCNTSLSILVYQFLQICSADLEINKKFFTNKYFTI